MSEENPPFANQTCLQAERLRKHSLNSHRCALSSPITTQSIRQVQNCFPVHFRLANELVICSFQKKLDFVHVTIWIYPTHTYYCRLHIMFLPKRQPNYCSFQELRYIQTGRISVWLDILLYTNLDFHQCSCVCVCFLKEKVSATLSNRLFSDLSKNG